MKNLLTALTFVFLSASLTAQPTHNPFRAAYPNAPVSHWTEVLRWNTVFNVVTFGANGNDMLSDQQATELAITIAHEAGGGVVFFPAGTYQFTDDLLLKPGVVLRGENVNLWAKDPNFRPSSRLEFPRYVFDTLANEGRGNPNSTAFKIIGGIGDFRNVGIVNLDINRARIEMHPRFDSAGQIPFSNWGNFQPVDKNRNCLIMGVRSNNATMPDPNVPDTTGPGKMRKWQRASFWFAANIDLYFDANVVVANNRLNDAPTDNFDQPGYRVRNQCTTCSTYRFIGQPANSTWSAENFIPVVSGEHARFRYEDHNGINLNRHKKMILNGRQTLRSFFPQPEPAQEPSLYAKGFSILDNWVYKTKGIGLWVAGQGLEIRRNVIRDSVVSGSWESPKKKWLNARSTRIERSPVSTNENRGIDFGGARVLIDSNDLQVRTHFCPELSFFSNDGEGVVDMGLNGGTRPYGVVVSRNVFDGNRQDPHISLGLFLNKEAHSVVFEGNRALNQNGYLIASLSDGVMTNVRVENNVGFRDIQLIARGGGRGSLVQNNPAPSSGTGKLILSCHVRKQNNPNFIPSVFPSGCEPNLATALDSSQFPVVRMVSPRRDTSLLYHPGIFRLEAVASPFYPDSVVFYRDAVHRIGTAYPVNGRWLALWMPPSEDGVYYITAHAYRTGSDYITVRGISAPLKFEIDDENPFVNNPTDQILNVSPTQKAPSVWLYPNPTRDRLNIHLEEGTDFKTLEVLDVLGRRVSHKVEAVQGTLDVTLLPPGLYTVRLETSLGLVSVRFRKE